MLVLDPTAVSFAGTRWEGVRFVQIDRRAARTAREQGDFGPFAGFVDVPEQRIGVRVEREVRGTELSMPNPGDLGELSFEASTNASGAGAVRVRVVAVVTDVSYQVPGGASGAGRPARRIVQFEAVSADGSTDPMTVEPLHGAGIGGAS